MKILGIDYGRKKVGLAISQGKLAQPLKVIKYTDSLYIINKIKKIIEIEKIEKVIVGVSEGEMARESKMFAEKLGAITFDETLSTYDALNLSLQANIKRKKRKKMEDAYAAAIMLQFYIDSKNTI